ncbi:MAG: hypothetical protein ACRDKJ_05115 [Actinomycetota bacterium]
MRFKLLGLVLVSALAASCGGGDEAQPSATPPDLDRQDLRRALLNAQDAGDAWAQTANPGPNTVQIGGRVGAASVRPSLAEATSAFDEKEGPGFVSDTVLLLRSTEVARAVITAHEDAAKIREWSQEREDGGVADFTIEGAVQNLPSLGDDMYAARLKSVITAADDSTSESSVEYVAFSVGPMVAFVVGQDTTVAVLARRLESRVARLLNP